GTASISIAKADATVAVVGYTGVYDGDPHGATGSATGIKGEDLSGLLDLGASFTNVPGGTASWSFAGNANYNPASGTASIVITPASQTISFGPLSNRMYGDAPFTVSATGGASGNPVTFTAAGNCTVAGNVVTLTGKGSCTITASQAGSLNYAAAMPVAQSFSIAGWKLRGFYQPVDMGGVLNTVKGGSTVPMKFEIFADTTELTAVSAIKSLAATKISCSSSAAIDDIELTATGGTSLRYDATSGQFIYNWQTPKGAGVCYRVTMTAQDGSTISADFKMK
ncbi:MAG TPA: PxKF domain-containing protein, partial [Chloroflexaceae bacterium]|nr:PxKF domain-containing protein [Chloroflexaceae bacterium]